MLPPVPTREMELEYLGFLKKSFASDPWFTYRFHKYMAGPKRIPWSNYREQVIKKRREFFVNFFIGATLIYPVSCAVGRWNKTTSGGVPRYPITRFEPKFPNTEPLQQSKIVFRKYSVLTSLAFGVLFAKLMANTDGLKNEWYSRPDFKPYPAMVKKEGIVKDQEEILMQKLYPWRYKSNYKQSSWFRFLFPESADWTIKKNPYSYMDSRDVYAPGNKHYVTYTNDFQDHLPH